MRKIAAILPCLCLALVPFAAKADSTVLITDNINGTIGPYSVTLTPGGVVDLFCLNNNFKISTGETWTAFVVDGSNLHNYFMGTTLTDYELEAYVISQLGHGFNDTDVQDALWYILNPGGPTPEDPLAVQALGADGTAFITAGDYDNYVYYIYDSSAGSPIGLTGNDTPTPQNFIDPTPLATTPVPEPSALLLLGTGLTGLAGVARRKLVRR